MRTSLTGGVCLLSALIATVTPLKCEQCFNITSNSCRGSEKICGASEKSCGSSYVEIITGLMHVNVFVKGCFNSSECNLLGFMNSKNNTIRAISKCCSSDNCDNGVISLPQENNTENGLQCPSCFAVYADNCNETTKINCTGAENRCLYYNGSKSTGDSDVNFALRACASESFCTSKRNWVFHGVSTRINAFECSSAICLHHSVFLLAVTGLHLMKLLS